MLSESVDWYLTSSAPLRTSPTWYFGQPSINVKPRIRRRSGGKIEIVCGREHLDGFMRYTELADAIKKWLEETSR